MKITRRQLRRLIAESFRDIPVKTVTPEQYADNVDRLPPSMRDVGDEARKIESPRNRHVVGNFFMTKGVPYDPPRGYSGLKKMLNFYMILPDGEAVSINKPGFEITNNRMALDYLNMLNQHVTPLDPKSLEAVMTMRKQINSVIAMMRKE